MTRKLYLEFSILTLGVLCLIKMIFSLWKIETTPRSEGSDFFYRIGPISKIFPEPFSLVVSGPMFVFILEPYSKTTVYQCQRKRIDCVQENFHKQLNASFNTILPGYKKELADTIEWAVLFDTVWVNRSSNLKEKQRKIMMLI